MRRFQLVSLGLILLTLFSAPSDARAESKRPNIVLILMDNLGWGEIGAYGGGLIRGAPTPRIDSLAEEGMKLLNFNVESQCTPSRAALMTGRYAIRTGAGKVPVSAGVYGITRWEYTLAEMLHDAGYETAMFGKWHLGRHKGSLSRPIKASTSGTGSQTPPTKHSGPTATSFATTSIPRRSSRRSWRVAEVAIRKASWSTT